MNRRLAQGLDADAAASDTAATEAVIALGANLGDRSQTLAAALADLDRTPLTRVRVAADPIETVALTPEGRDSSAPSYLNTVAIVETRLAPTVLLDYLHAIEERHGRAPRVAGEARWQDRTLDLDLIAYGDLRIDTPRLTVPHPRAADRDFVLLPWASIDPGAVLPGRGAVADLIRALRPDGAQ